MNGRDSIARTPTVRTLEIRWSALHSRWLSDADQPLAEQCPYSRAEFVIVLTMIDPVYGVIDAWIETDRHRRMIRKAVPVRYIDSEHAGMFHIDAALELNRAKAPLLMVTFRGSSELLFAQSPLLAETGWVGGSYDPPSGTRRCIRDDVNSTPTPQPLSIRQ